ncbi:glutathione S-transferase T3-like protein [Tanacetum coccineum]|uniref:Glutathione S-transferase T3-like protein n=1 Tax=Tanacetum coccineum TaxID=301880 RepID=A0ABQ4Y1J3_9ASTR
MTLHENMFKVPFQQSQPQPRFNEPQPPTKDIRRGKRIAKRATVDLDEDDEEKEQARQCSRWTREEEILLFQCWIENSENSEIEADRNEDSFWRHILQYFNNSTIHGSRTKNMLTCKLTRINGDCQKFNAIYKHLERKSGENEADHIENAKINFAAQQAKGRKSSYARAMIELWADVELKDTLVVDIPKFEGEGYTRSTIRVEYERKPQRCSTCKVFSHVLDECPKKFVSDVLKNLKMERQGARGPPIGLKRKSNFVYRSFQPTNKTSGKKKQARFTRQEVSNLNPFDAFNMVENDDDVGTNGGNSKLAETMAISNVVFFYSRDYI